MAGSPLQQLSKNFLVKSALFCRRSKGRTSTWTYRIYVRQWPQVSGSPAQLTLESMRNSTTHNFISWWMSNNFTKRNIDKLKNWTEFYGTDPEEIPAQTDKFFESPSLASLSQSTRKVASSHKIRRSLTADGTAIRRSCRKYLWWLAHELPCRVLPRLTVMWKTDRLSCNRNYKEDIVQTVEALTFYKSELYVFDVRAVTMVVKDFWIGRATMDLARPESAPTQVFQVTQSFWIRRYGKFRSKYDWIVGANLKVRTVRGPTVLDIHFLRGLPFTLIFGCSLYLPPLR